MARFSITLFSGLTLALLACGCGSGSGKAKTADAAPASAPGQYVGQTGEAPILNRQGNPIGTVYLTEGPEGLLVRLRFDAGALPAGWHGVHFHQVGGCDDGGAGFTHSGGHIGAGEGKHGLVNPTGPEPGDLPSLLAPASGPFEAEFYSPFLTLAPSAQGRSPIWDADGASLIIHANRDDQTSQPIGGAGERIACAVFTAG